MEKKVNAYVQGINQNLTHANGSYDSHELGEMNAEELMKVLKKIQHFEMPEAGSDEDLCPPEITVQGPAGDFMFDPWDGELHEVESQIVVTPFEAAMLATGQKAISQLVDEKGIELPATEEVSRNVYTESQQTQPPPQAGCMKKGIGFIVSAIVFCFGGLFALGLVAEAKGAVGVVVGFVIFIVTILLTRFCFRKMVGPGSSSSGDGGYYHHGYYGSHGNYHSGGDDNNSGDDGGGGDDGGCGGCGD